MTRPVGAVFEGFGDNAPLDFEAGPHATADILYRIHSGTWDAFADTAAHVGYCTHPVRLRGRTTRIDAATGEVLSEFRSQDQPLGALYQRCGNRRARVCPSCSRLYARDTFEMVRAGVLGGKTVPTTVTDNPLLFVTLTAPSFGPVHSTRGGTTCRPRRPGGRPLCPHGKPTWCMHHHGDDDPALGTPLCQDCYRYDHHLVWQWWSPELWRRYTITLGRALADALGVRPSGLRDVASIQYAKVAEVQHRGAIHFHALIRLDGPAREGVGAPAPDGITAARFAALAQAAASRVSYLAPPPVDSMRALVLRFGTQTDVKTVRAGHRPDDPGQALQPEQVAAYLAKYATKDAGDVASADRNPHYAHLVTLCHTWAGAARGRDKLRRAGHIVPGQLGKDGLDAYAKIGKWGHMLGFRGHFSTKSRRYSLTLGSLRRARARFQQLTADAQRTGRHLDLDFVDLIADDPDDDTTLVVKEWRYESTGWDTSTDEALALAAASRAREYAQWKAATTHPHSQESRHA